MNTVSIAAEIYSLRSTHGESNSMATKNHNGGERSKGKDAFCLMLSTLTPDNGLTKSKIRTAFNLTVGDSRQLKIEIVSRTPKSFSVREICS